MDETKMNPEPFGYFKAEPFGWIDCAETDDGAQPLYDQAAIDALKKQRDVLLAALEQIANESTRNLGSARIIARAAIARVKGGAAR